VVGFEPRFERLEYMAQKNFDDWLSALIASLLATSTLGIAIIVLFFAHTR
jgi:hypothetical protein